MRLKIFIVLILLISNVNIVFQQEKIIGKLENFKNRVIKKINERNVYIKKRVSKQDSLFIEHLRKQWRSMQTIPSKSLYKIPKPDTIPIFEGNSTIESIKDINGTYSENIKKNYVKDKTKAEINYIREISSDTLNINYFGVEIIVVYDISFEESKFNFNSINYNTISDFWKSISCYDHKMLINQIGVIGDSLYLNDWGLLELVYKLSRRIFEKNENLSVLFTWYIMVKMGYDIRIGYNKDKIFLLIPANSNIYSTSYLIIDDRYYYVISFETENLDKNLQLFTYEFIYPNSNKKIDLEIIDVPRINLDITELVLSFNYDNKEYIVPLKLSTNLIRFYNSYPQTDLHIYFKAPIYCQTEESIIKAFKPILKDKSEAESVNMLLRFVQTAFSYKNDFKQFGKEKAMFPDEVLYYRYSDCEDRSILFAHLVDKLLNLKVIGLKYPGHVATAVLLNDSVNGYFIEYNNKKYVICDPTYINADLGYTLPQYKNIHPELVIY